MKHKIVTVLPKPSTSSEGDKMCIFDPTVKPRFWISSLLIDRPIQTCSAVSSVRHSQVKAQQT